MGETSSKNGAEGPVGSGDYAVRDSDCVLKLAYEHGLTWEKLWKHPDNAELNDVRKHPELLLPGDRVSIPPIETESVSGSTEQRHRFRRKGVPGRVRLRFLRAEPPEEEEATGGAEADPDDLHASSEDPDPADPPPEEPWADVPYRLVIDGETSEGTTDANGEVSFAIPPNARTGKIVLDPGTERETDFALNLGRLDPIREPSGVQQRLANLGFAVGEPTSEWTPELVEALENFQEHNELEVTGEFGASTRQKLEELHGA